MSEHDEEASEAAVDDEIEDNGEQPDEDSGAGENIENSDRVDDQEPGDAQAQDSSDEDEEEDNEYDLTDKFIAQEDEDDDDDDEDGAEDGQKRRKHRHKRRRERSPQLDDDDYQLLADNQVTGIRRKQQSARKRIRKQQDDQNKTEAQRLQEELFGIDDGAGLEEEAPEASRPAAVDDFAVSEDEMDDFIDDDEEGDGSRRKGRVRARGSTQGVSTHGIQEMQDVFGDVDDLLEMYAEKRATAILSKEGEADEEEPLEPADEEDPDAVAAYEEQQKLRKQQRRQKAMEAAIEPELMEKLMMLPLDERIRETDAPERFQLTGQADLKDAFSNEQLEDAARFILEQLIGPAPGTVNDPGLPSVVAKDRKARSVLERGMVEVDGKPRDGAQRPNPGYWERSELMDNVTDLTRGHRGVKIPRDRTKREAWKGNMQARAAVEASIASVLREMWNQRHEIPLIACFRKELCGELLSMQEKDRPNLTTSDDVRIRRRTGQPEYEIGTVQAKHRRLRRWEILWAVYDLSAKWRAMLKRKQKRTEVYQLAHQRCQAWLQTEDGGSRLEEVQEAIQACITDTADADSMETLDDIDLKFKLVTSGIGEHFAEDLALGVRRPQRTSAYSLLKQANLEDVLRAMAMPAADFGDNLDNFLKRNGPEESKIMPNDLAFNHVTDDSLFNSPEKVLERARQIHVMEVVHEPRVRAFVRKRMDQHMFTTTRPLPAGETQLDAFHTYGCVKRLKKMPAYSFNGTDLYLRIHLAQKEGLIDVISEVDNLEDLFVQPMLDFYQSSGVSPVVKEWNSIRQAMVREVVKKLVPQLQEETSNRLLSEAREVVVESYGEELWKHASLPPVQMKSEEGDVVERRRIAACCWGEGRPATCLVMLDDQGSLADILYLPSFSDQQRVIRAGLDYSIAEDPRKADDVKRVVEFCRENRPQAIFVGARNLNCKALKEDMSRIGDFILDAHAQILTSGHDTGTIEVLYSDETIAELWANSSAAREEFPDHPDVVRRAVAVGRMALEPLAVLASLCRPGGQEILSLNLHPLQSQVSEGELLKAAERSLMTVVAQVGADINVMASNMWQSASLPFVAGLGPRKAQALLQAVQAQEFALNRVSLWKEIWKPGNVVFRNCGAFLKITAKARSLVNAEVEPIDSARIEPLSYKLAFRMARTAVGSTGSDAQQDVIDTNKAMSRPEMVEALNLEDLHEALADDSEDPEVYNQISTLVDIAMEFIAPNMELRPGNIMEMAVQKERQFWWMVGDNQQSLKKGRRVEAVVRYVGQNEVKCSLPELGGLDALLSATDISSRGPVTPSDFLKAGQSINARVKQVRPEDFLVDITTTSTDLNDEAYWEEKYSRGSNPYYHVQTAEERRNIEAEKRRLARSKELTKRTIDHPNFRNVSINEAVKQLVELPSGEAIFRPHPKTTDLICLTIKLHDGEDGDLIIHRDVHEGRKRGGHLTLGHPLKIYSGSSSTIRKEHKFEDLDEIMARFVTPMFERFQEVVKHRKFRDGMWNSVQQSLHMDAAKMQTGTATYCLASDPLNPGNLYIACILPTAKRTARREYFTITPDGFYYRKKLHKTLDKMMNVFKRNPQGEQAAQAVPPADLMPPTLHAPMAPVQFAGQHPYPQQYPQQMPGGYVHAYEPQGISLMPRPQQQAYR